MPPDDQPELNWSATEVHEKSREAILRTIPKEIRQGVRKQHYSLGHPAKTTYLRMMRLANASDAAIEYCKAWQRPVCESAQGPTNPLESTASLRPYGHNKFVSLEFKYLTIGRSTV